MKIFRYIKDKIVANKKTSVIILLIVVFVLLSRFIILLLPGMLIEAPEISVSFATCPGNNSMRNHTVDGSIIVNNFWLRSTFCPGRIVTSDTIPFRGAVIWNC